MELDTSQIHFIGGNARPIHVTVDINDISLSMELDTGAAVSLISEQQYKSSLSTVPLLESEVVLKTYTGENMRVLGELTVTAKYGSQCQDLPLVVIAGNGPPLLGRNWLQHFRLDWDPLKSGTIHVRLTSHWSLFCKSILRYSRKNYEKFIPRRPNSC